MLLLKSISTILAVASSVLAIPYESSASRVVAFKSSVFHKLAQPPMGWERDESVIIDKDGSSIKMRIHLVQQRMGEFHDLALKVRFSIFTKYRRGSELVRLFGLLTR